MCTLQYILFFLLYFFYFYLIENTFLWNIFWFWLTHWVLLQDSKFSPNWIHTFSSASSYKTSRHLENYHKIKENKKIKNIQIGIGWKNKHKKDGQKSPKAHIVAHIFEHIGIWINQQVRAKIKMQVVYKVRNEYLTPHET